jgi:hypothetical protein
LKRNNELPPFLCLFHLSLPPFSSHGGKGMGKGNGKGVGERKGVGGKGKGKRSGRKSVSMPISFVFCLVRQQSYNTFLLIILVFYFSHLVNSHKMRVYSCISLQYTNKKNNIKLLKIK